MYADIRPIMENLDNPTIDHSPRAMTRLKQPGFQEITWARITGMISDYDDRRSPSFELEGT